MSARGPPVVSRGSARKGAGHDRPVPDRRRVASEAFSHRRLASPGVPPSPALLAAGPGHAGPCLDLLEPRREQTNFVRIPDPAVMEQAADEDTGKVQLADVGCNQRTHVPGPRRHARARRVLAHRAGVSQSEDGVAKAMLRDHRRVRQPRPPPVRILKEPPEDEFEHPALPHGVRHRTVQPRCREHGRVRPRIEIDDCIEPARDELVVEVHERDAHARLAVVGQESQHEQLRQHPRFAERRDLQHGIRGYGAQRLQLRPGIRTPRVPSELQRQRRRQHPSHRERHIGDAPLEGSARSPVHGRGCAQSAFLWRSNDAAAKSRVT